MLLEDRAKESSHLSSLRHWKWIEESSSSTPVLSGSCLHSCIQWRSAASKSPDWYSRCASSANPWKESICLVGSEAPTQPKGGGKQHVRRNGNEIKLNKKNRQKQWCCFRKMNAIVWNHVYAVIYAHITIVTTKKRKEKKTANFLKLALKVPVMMIALLMYCHPKINSVCMYACMYACMCIYIYIYLFLIKNK